VGERDPRAAVLDDVPELGQFPVQMPRIGAGHRDRDRAGQHAPEEARDELQTIRRKNQEYAVAGPDPGRPQGLRGPGRAPDDLRAVGRFHLVPVAVEERIEGRPGSGAEAFDHRGDQARGHP